MVAFAHCGQWLADVVDSCIISLEYKLLCPGTEIRSKTYLTRSITVIVVKDFQNLLGFILG